MTQLFNAGQVGMCVDAIALYQTLIDPNESSFYDKVGVAPIPEGPAGRQSYKQVVWGASIYSGSKNKEAAVSYTHLDVYKRQHRDCPGASEPAGRGGNQP